MISPAVFFLLRIKDSLCSFEFLDFPTFHEVYHWNSDGVALNL